MREFNELIPFALFLYWIEIWFLFRLLMETKNADPLLLDLRGSNRPANELKSHTEGYKLSVL